MAKARQMQFPIRLKEPGRVNKHWAKEQCETGGKLCRSVEREMSVERGIAGWQDIGSNEFGMP